MSVCKGLTHYFCTSLISLMKDLLILNRKRVNQVNDKIASILSQEKGCMWPKGRLLYNNHCLCNTVKYHVKGFWIGWCRFYPCFSFILLIINVYQSLQIQHSHAIQFNMNTNWFHSIFQFNMNTNWFYSIFNIIYPHGLV